MATILLIDDSRDLIDVIQQLLELEGHTVRMATTAREALHLLDSGYCPDLIACDYQLHETTGIILLKQIRTLPVGATALIVICSGSPDYRADALTAGADGFIVKPYTHKDLIPFLKAHL
jgi:CheY-like chemotaxis protein